MTELEETGDIWISFCLGSFVTGVLYFFLMANFLTYTVIVTAPVAIIAGLASGFVLSRIKVTRRLIMLAWDMIT